MNFVGIDKLSLLDYEEKMACVLFCKPCNFRCPFCHNGLTVLTSEDEISWDDIISYLNKRHGMLDAVVISGGEPTLMPDLIDKITQIKKMGFLVKLDTNGTNPDVVEYLISHQLIDYVAMDIKNAPNKYAITSGCLSPNIDNIKKTISLLINSSIGYEFRTTLVKEFHSLEDMPSLGELIKGAPILFLQQFVERDGCIKKGLHPISEEEANKFKEVLLQYVKEVKLRGY